MHASAARLPGAVAGRTPVLLWTENGWRESARRFSGHASGRTAFGRDGGGRKPVLVWAENGFARERTPFCGERLRA